MPGDRFVSDVSNGDVANYGCEVQRLVVRLQTESHGLVTILSRKLCIEIRTLSQPLTRYERKRFYRIVVGRTHRSLSGHRELRFRSFLIGLGFLPIVRRFAPIDGLASRLFDQCKETPLSIVHEGFKVVSPEKRHVDEVRREIEVEVRRRDGRGLNAASFQLRQNRPWRA